MSQRIIWTAILALIYTVLIHYVLTFSGEVQEPRWYANWQADHARATIKFSTAIHYSSLLLAAIIAALVSVAVLNEKVILPTALAGAAASYILYRSQIDALATALYSELAAGRLPSRQLQELTQLDTDSVVIFLGLPIVAILFYLIAQLRYDLDDPYCPSSISNPVRRPQKTGKPNEHPKPNAKKLSPFDKRPPPDAAMHAKSAKGRTRSLELQLLNACLGDRKKAERLIEFEHQSQKGISRSEAIRRALASIERDNH